MLSEKSLSKTPSFFQTAALEIKRFSIVNGDDNRFPMESNIMDWDGFELTRLGYKFKRAAKRGFRHVKVCCWSCSHHIKFTRLSHFTRCSGSMQNFTYNVANWSYFHSTLHTRKPVIHKTHTVMRMGIFVIALFLRLVVNCSKSPEKLFVDTGKFYDKM